MNADVDAIVVGAGVVGLAIARCLALEGREVLVIESENAIGSATSSRNSEVIHAGIYYAKNSNKARLCVRGKELLYAYLLERDLPHRRCGKIIVGTTEQQRETLASYRQKAVENGVGELRWIERDELSELEPAVQGAVAVFSPTTGIIDSHRYMVSLQGDLEARGGVIAFNTPVQSMKVLPGAIEVATGGDTPMAVSASLVVNSAGLNAPGLAARVSGARPESFARAYFARGRYYAMSGKNPFRHLVYPVAEAGGLGVHVTLDLEGQARFGPDVSWIDDIDYAFDDSEKERFVDAIRRYYPALDPDRLHPSYTGIRPKLRGAGDGETDFVIQGKDAHGVPGLINLLGIESPGLTASLAIAEEVLACTKQT